MIGAWQGIQFKRTVDATKEIGSAAIGVELPQLHIMSVIGGRGIIDGFPTNQSNPRITGTVKNYGRTPAFVTNYIINVIIAQELPKFPIYRLLTQEMREMVITDDVVSIHENGLSRSQYLQ